METSTQKLFRLDSQVSVDAAPDAIRADYKSLVMQESSLSLVSKDVSVDALPRNDSAPEWSRTCKDNVRVSYAPIHGDCSMVFKSVQDKIQSCLDSTDESSLDESFSSSFKDFLISKDDDSWRKNLDEFKRYMPPDIKIGYYDVMVLYSEDNQNEAEKFCQHLRSEIQLKSGEPVKAVLYDCDELTSLAGTKLQHLEKALERCTYVFIFMTKEFCEDKWMELSSEECLMKAIYDEEKRWCVVPVYTVSRRNAKFKIPMGLNSLKGINYYNNDQFYRNGVSRLIEDKQYQRLKNEDKHQSKQYEWLQRMKRKLISDEENKKRLEYMERMKTDQHILEEKSKTDDLLNRALNQQHPMASYDSGKYHYPAMHYSSSEPGLQNKFYNTPHSASSDCLVQVDGNDMQHMYNMANFQNPITGNAGFMEKEDPYSRMPLSKNPPPYMPQISSPSQYNMMAAYQGQPSQGQIQSFGYDVQLVQRTNQLYQQNPNLLPLSTQQTPNQMSCTQFAQNPQQTQNVPYFAEQLSQSGLGVQQLDHIEDPDYRLGPYSSMQQSVNQTAVSTSALYSKGSKPVGFPPQNTVGQRENCIGDNQHSMEPPSCRNETPLNNSSLSADELSQPGDANNMEPTAKETSQCIPDLEALGQNSDFSHITSFCSRSDRSGPEGPEGGALPNFGALSLPPSMDGRTLTCDESVGSQKSSASQSQGGKGMQINQLEENTSHSATMPENKGTYAAESGTETIRKTKGDGEQVIIHHHYHYYEKEKDDPKIINIYDAKTVQIGDSPTVVESKKLPNKSKIYKELPVQKETTNVKIQSTLSNVAPKVIDAESKNSEDLPVSGISKLKDEHASEANHNSRQSEDFLSFAPRASQSKEDEEIGKEELFLRNKSNDHNKKNVLEEIKDSQIYSIPDMEKKNEPTPLGTKFQIKSKPIATVPPSPSVVQNQPFKKNIDTVNEETVLKTAGREQSDDTRLKTVHESRGRILHETGRKIVFESGTVHETQTESEETTLKLSAPQRATNRASPFKGESQADKSQYQAPIHQRTPNRTSTVKSQIDLGLYQPGMRPGHLVAKAYPFAAPAVTMASAFHSDEMSTGHHDPLGENIPSQDELDEDTFQDGRPPVSEGFVPITQENKDEWLYLETDSFEAHDLSGVDQSNSRRRKKPSSSTTDNKSCTLS